MARIPEYTRTESLGGGSTGPQADASSFSGSAEGPAARQFMGAALDLAGVLDHRRRQDEAVWVNNMATTADLHWKEYITKATESGDVEKPGFAGRIQGEFDKYRDETLKAAPSNSSQAALLGHLNGLGESVIGHAMGVEAHARMAARARSIAETIDKAAMLAYRGGDYEAGVKLANGQADFVSKVGGISAGSRASLHTGSKEILRATLMGIAEKDPAQAAQLIEDGKFDGKLDSTFLIGALHSLKAKAEASRMIGENDYKTAMKDNFERIKMTGEGLPGMIPPSDPRKKAAFDSKVNDANLTFQARSFLLNNSPSDSMTFLNSLKAKADEAKYPGHVLKDVSEWYVKQDTLLHKDPATATLQDPFIRKAFDASTAAFADAGQDPGKLAEAQAARATYVKMAEAQQQIRGLSVGEINAIPLKIAQEYASKIRNGTLDQKMQTFDRIQLEWGGQYQAVFRAMQSPALPAGDRLAGHDLALGNMKGEPVAMDFAAMMRTPEKEVQQGMELRGVKPTDISKEIGSQKAIVNLSRAIGSGNRLTDYVGMAGAAEDLAKFYIATGKAKTPQAAATMAVSSMYDNKFKFAEINGSTLMIPSADRSGNAYSDLELNRIGANLRSLLLDYTQGTSSAFVDWKQFGFRHPQADEAKNIADVKSLAAKRLTWAVRGDMQGAQLVWRDSSGHDQPVVDTGGRIIARDYESLSQQILRDTGMTTPPLNVDKNDTGLTGF